MNDNEGDDRVLQGNENEMKGLVAASRFVSMGGEIETPNSKWLLAMMG